MIDIHDYLGRAECLLYADDLKLYMEITDSADASLLQTDLNGLLEWSTINKIPLNINKCKVISISRGRGRINIEYKIGGQTLDKVDAIRDLGVTIQSNLLYNDQNCEAGQP